MGRQPRYGQPALAHPQCAGCHRGTRRMEYAMSTMSPPRADALTPVNWDDVHAVVQDVLAPLAIRVRQLRPDARPEPGRTNGRGPTAYLFSYWAFDIPS